ncbi:ABC transporter transmembrane domain-containing protein, partial [Klebsiella pneumoniae]|uniref:ABC transporter transmembrane domain-containing protein n=1 Tax=Klebsiella pneumoniae TaxID=573 RepID=UPI0027311CD4
QKNINKIKIIHSLKQKKKNLQTFQKKSKNIIHKNILITHINSLFNPTISLIIKFSFLITIYYKSILIIKNKLTINNLITFTTYL